MGHYVTLTLYGVLYWTVPYHTTSTPTSTPTSTSTIALPQTQTGTMSRTPTNYDRRLTEDPELRSQRELIPSTIHRRKNRNNLRAGSGQLACQKLLVFYILCHHYHAHVQLIHYMKKVELSTDLRRLGLARGIDRILVLTRPPPWWMDARCESSCAYVAPNASRFTTSGFLFSPRLRPPWEPGQHKSQHINT